MPVIKTFKTKATERVFQGYFAREFDSRIQARAEAKLTLIDAAERIDDLRSPPSNRLEKLSGDRVGQYSVRINQQWRICFAWKDGDAYDVEICDYH